MKASSIYEITGRPVPQNTDQTVVAGSNITLPEQPDAHIDLSRPNTSSPVPSVSTAELERAPESLNWRLPSSKGLNTIALRTTVCVISPISATFSNDTFFAEAVDGSVDDIHPEVVDDTVDEFHPDYPLGHMELTDAYIQSMHIIPHLKNNGEIQFRALKLDSSILTNTDDQTYSSRATFRKSPYLPSQRVKQKVPKSPPRPASEMSMTELEAMLADFNKLPPTAYQVPKHTPNILQQRRTSRNHVVFNVSACAYLLSWAISICLHANALPMLSAILAALALLSIMTLHVHNNFGIIRKCFTTSWVNKVTAIFATFAFGLLPPTTGESQLSLKSATALHFAGPQVPIFQIQSNATVNASHNLSDAPASFIYWDANLLAATFIMLSLVFVTICLNIPWSFSRKQSWSDMQILPFKNPWNIQDSCSLLMTSRPPASDTCVIPPQTSAITHNGMHACPSISDDCIRACASINLEASYPGHRVGMIDSGCNETVFKHDQEMRQKCIDFNPGAATVGSGVSSEFRTDGSATATIALLYTNLMGQQQYRHIQTKVNLCTDFFWDLFPVKWLQKLGHSVLFDGRTSLHDPSEGITQVTICELTPDSKITLGYLKLITWQNLTFFPYKLIDTVRSSTTSMCAHSANIFPGNDKISRTTKFHVVFGHASPHRTRILLKYHGTELSPELPCVCQICASVKSSAPSRRKYEKRHVSAEEVTGNHFKSANVQIQGSIDEMTESDERSAQYEKIQQLRSDLIKTPDSELTKINEHVRSLLPTNRRSSSPGEYWHCDTITLGKCWDGFNEALVLVDDFSRKIFVYAMKTKRQQCVAEALTKHFNKVQLPQSGQRHLNFYTHRLVLRSDQGSEFINTTVQSFCNAYGITQEFSCPGDLGKWQNGVCERRIKDLCTTMNAVMLTSNLPSTASVYAMYHAADVLNALPSSANPTDDGHVGMPPDYIYDTTVCDVDNHFAFGSFCSAHLDSDHTDDDPKVKAASCVYLSKSHHTGCSGHFVWDYANRRRLTVPSISNNQWNFFPLRAPGDRHLSTALTFESPPMPDSSADIHAEDTSSTLPIPTDYNPACAVLPQNHTHLTRLQKEMQANIGRKIRKMFFVDDHKKTTDYYEGTIHSVTDTNLYYVVYSDNDSETITQAEFKKYSQPVSTQANAHILNHKGYDHSCNCTSDCYHPWGNHAPAHNASTIRAAAAIRRQDHSYYSPSLLPPPLENMDAYAAMFFGAHMSCFDFRDPITRMIAMSSRVKHSKLSAYERDPTSIQECEKSVNWKAAKQGNSWYESIMTEINNLVKYDVFTVVSRQSTGGANIFPTLINFLTKRKKESTAEKEVIDKRKTRIVFGGHKMTRNKDFNPIDAYAPVPSWTVVKLQLALAAIYKLKLKAFDCTAAYLQTPIDFELYVTPPSGIIKLMKYKPDSVWKLNRALYGHPMSANLWYTKLFTYLKGYGFKPLGNSATFMCLDRRDCKTCPGLILLNVYSDDGLGATSSDQLWDNFMTDFKSKFDLEEKEPDYFLGCGITQDLETGKIQLDPSKYIREMIAKYDMTEAVTSPLPMPAGTKIYMPQEDETDILDAEATNLYQQMTGSIMYCSLLRPDLMYYASQLSKFMSRPTAMHMGLVRKVLQYLHGTYDNVITYRPVGCDNFEEKDCSFLSFSDSDWACAIDTRRSHGCHVLMLAGGAISWRSRSHKSVMLSTAAAEYYEGSEACREVAFIRSIMEDLFKYKLDPTPLLIDNQAAICMSKLPHFTEKQKHIPIRICHLKECCAEQMVELHPVDTKNQLADIGTKALAQPIFERLKSVLFGKIRFSDINDRKCT